VAIKAFTLELTGDQAAAFAERLESLVSVGLTHPSIVAPIEAGLEGDTPYLVEEYVFGESLDVALRRYGPAPAADAARLLTQVAAALDAGSSVGVLHGTLHPRDVLVTPDLVRVTGLGVVAALERTGVRPPARPPYSAPEVDAGGPWEARADAFSLARIAMELLTGRSAAEPEGSPAFDFEGMLVARPEELRQVLLRALAPKPRHRHATAGELAAALELALTGRLSRVARADRVAPRSGDGSRRRRAKPRREAPSPLEVKPQRATEVSLEPALSGMDEENVVVTAALAMPLRTEDRPVDSPLRPADTGPLSVDPDLTRPDVEQAGAGGRDVPPIEIASPQVVSEVGDTFRPAAPEPEQPVLELGLAAHPPIESPSRDTEPVAADDLPLEPRPVAAEPVAERPGSLPFEEREPVPQAPEPIASPDDGRVEDGVEGEVEGGGGETSVRRPLVLLVTFALAAALILGIYGAYRLAIPKGATPAESTTASVPSAPPSQGPVAPDIYLPAAAKPTAAVAPRPAVRPSPTTTKTTKTTKTTTAPRTKASSTPAARPPAAKTGPGSLSVESRPTGARVFVDGRLSGTTPLVLSKVTAGSHDVRVERTGYRRWSARIRVTSGRRARLTASLEPESSR
jgi:PEGA domain/Protein kinase domain